MAVKRPPFLFDNKFSSLKRFFEKSQIPLLPIKENIVILVRSLPEKGNSHAKG